MRIFVAKVVAFGWRRSGSDDSNNVILERICLIHKGVTLSVYLSVCLFNLSVYLGYFVFVYLMVPTG